MRAIHKYANTVDKGTEPSCQIAQAKNNSVPTPQAWDTITKNTITFLVISELQDRAEKSVQYIECCTAKGFTLKNWSHTNPSASPKLTVESRVRRVDYAVSTGMDYSDLLHSEPSDYPELAFNLYTHAMRDADLRQQFSQACWAI